MELCSVIIPCFNEEDAIPIFYREISKHVSQLKDLNFEFIFVDDGSKDNTFTIMKSLSEKDIRVKYIGFSRNFGKESALYAGLKACKGDYAVVMDVDLQDPPSLLPLMYKAIKEEGYDCVATRRTNRKGEPPIRSFFAHKFYQLINKISKVQIVDGARDYRFMKRKVVDAILSMSEYNRFSKGIFGWVGFETKWIDFENVERVAGNTKWSFWKLVIYSVEGIVAFSTAPLAIASIIGMLLFAIAIIALVFIVVRALFCGDPVAGWPSTVCIMMFIGGIQLFCMGIIGLYLSKAYLETKNRPIYIVDDTNITD